MFNQLPILHGLPNANLNFRSVLFFIPFLLFRLLVTEYFVIFVIPTPVILPSHKLTGERSCKLTSPRPPELLQNHPLCIWWDAQSSVYLGVYRMKKRSFPWADDSPAEALTPQSACRHCVRRLWSPRLWKLLSESVWTVKDILSVLQNVLFFLTPWRFGVLIYIVTDSLLIALENAWAHYQRQTCSLMLLLITCRREVIALCGPCAFISTRPARVQAIWKYTSREAVQSLTFG